MVVKLPSLAKPLRLEEGSKTAKMIVFERRLEEPLGPLRHGQCGLNQLGWVLAVGFS